MKEYAIYDIVENEYTEADRYYCVNANSPIDAIKKYMHEISLTGKVVRTITDENIRFIVHNSRGRYLYQLV